MSAGELIKNLQASSDDAQHWPRIYAGAIEKAHNSARIRMAI